MDEDRGMRSAELTPENLKSMRKCPNLANGGDDVLPSEFDIASVLCLTLIRDNIMPRCKGSRFTSDENKFLHCFRSGIFMNIGELILSELQKRIVNMRSTTSMQHTICFPSLITGLLRKFGVKEEEEPVTQTFKAPYWRVGFENLRE